MTDLVLLLLLAGFFALTSVFVWLAGKLSSTEVPR